MADIRKAAVYVGTYAKYNNGSTLGEWVQLANFADKNDFLDYCRELHSDEDEPEFMFQDWESIPDGLVSECNIDEFVFELINCDDELFYGEKDAFFRFLEMAANRESVGAYLDAFRDAYLGYYPPKYLTSALQQYAHVIAEELLAGVGNRQLAYYFNYEAFARDMEIEGQYWETDEGYLFNGY